MLLTSSQISMGISSAIVFTFSTILFLSGYILQQQTVRDLELVLKPPPDPVLLSNEAEEFIVQPDNINWDKVAYVQILQQYADVCTSAITFAELSRQKSQARRLVLYPSSWDEKSDAQPSRHRERNLRLLRKTAARYNISIRPIENEGMEGAMMQAVSFTRLYAFNDLQALIYLNPSGVVYNATALDELFSLDPIGAGLHFPSAAPELALTGYPIAAILKPSMMTYQRLLKNDVPIASLEDMVEATESNEKYATHLFGETSVLKHSGDGIGKSDAGLSAYMYFSDPGILGPEYDVPTKQWITARPETTRERMLWESIYADYRAQRMAVCGLDVEPMPLVMQPPTADAVDDERTKRPHTKIEKLSL